MQIVIDIPDEDYNVILENANYYIEKHWGLPTVWSAIVSGTLLPKGHGELIDKEVVLDMMNHGILEEYINILGGVIPADKEE